VETLGKRAESLCYCRSKRGGRLVALAPFCIVPSRIGMMGSRKLSFLAGEFVGSDYLNILVEAGMEGSATAEIARFLAQHTEQWDYIELCDGDGDSPVFAELRDQLKRLGMTERTAPASVCYYIELPGSFEKYLAEVASNLRWNFRRRGRNLEREGPVKFITLAGGAELEQGFADLVRLHSLRFQHRGKESAFLGRDIQAFHSVVLKRMAAHGWVRLDLLRIREQTVAALYGLAIGRKFSNYQVGMDPAWLRFGVGSVIVGRSIQEAIQSGFREFDFLRGPESYKSGWATGMRHTLNARFFDRRPKSQWALAMTMLREEARLVKSSVRRVWRRLESVGTPDKSRSQKK